MKFLQLITIAILLIAINNNAVRADDIDSDLMDQLMDDLEAGNLDPEDLRELEDIETRRKYDDLMRENEHLLREMSTLNEVDGQPPKLHDPCRNSRCGAGRICKAENDVATCVCIPECPEEVDPRRKVCTNLNETWSSDCEVHRQRCMCDNKEVGCRGEEIKHLHIDYYGECRELPTCTEDEKNDFPRRMRDWLFNVMRDLADRRELNQHYIEMTHEAETNLTKRWTNAAIWKWCDLDSNDNRDSSVSRHELFPIRAPLMALEHCIAPFLESCDPDNDHRITLTEWGNCLELNDGDLTERCAELSSEKEKKVTVDDLDDI